MGPNGNDVKPKSNALEVTFSILNRWNDTVFAVRYFLPNCAGGERRYAARGEPSGGGGYTGPIHPVIYGPVRRSLALLSMGEATALFPRQWLQWGLERRSDDVRAVELVQFLGYGHERVGRA